jgi:zinc transport system substrate-binding protein
MQYNCIVAVFFILKMEIMMTKGISAFFLTLWCCTVLVSTGYGADKPMVFVSIVPQKYFVQQIAQNLLDVEVMVESGANPATYEPKPSQMAKLSRASIYFAIGVPFEKAWLGKISAVNPAMQLVFTDEGIEKIAMKEHHHGMSEQGIAGQRHHGIPDPHIWLSPALVKQQAKVMLIELKSILPDRSSKLEENYRRFIEKISSLDLKLRNAFQGVQGVQFIVFHPSWGYFARDYGLQQIAVELEGKSPKFSQLQELIHYARENAIHVLFVQPQFSTKKAKIIAREIRGKVVTADPLAEDWFANMRDVAQKIKSAVK